MLARVYPLQRGDATIFSRVWNEKGTGGQVFLARSYGVIQLLFILLIAIGYGIVFHNQLTFGLEMDEAINLTVVKNLAEGNGYSTNVEVSGNVIFRTFDPTVSTGPTVLGPSAFLWNISDGNLALTRLVPLSFFVIYLGALFQVVRKLWGTTPALIALSMPLLLNVSGPDLLTHGLSVGRFIGEFAIAALTYLGILLLMRRSYIAASLVLGLAGLTKLNWLLVSITVLVVWFAFLYSRDRTYRVTTWLWSALALFIPIIAFEAFKVITLGVGGYRDSLANYQTWLDGQGKGVIAQYLESDAFTWVEKIVGIASSPTYKERLLDLLGLVSGSGLILLLLGIATLTGAALASKRSQPDSEFPSVPDSMQSTQSTQSQQSMRPAVIVAIIVPALLFVAYWLVGMAQDSARVGLPFWLLVGPLLGVAVYLVTQVFNESSKPGFGAHSLLQLPLALFLAGALIVQSWTALNNDSGRELLTQQTQGAHILTDLEVSDIPRNGFWSNPELQVLVNGSELGTGSNRLDSVIAFTSVQALLEKGEPDATLYLETCKNILYQSQALLICQQ